MPQPHATLKRRHEAFGLGHASASSPVFGSVARPPSARCVSELCTTATIKHALAAAAGRGGSAPAHSAAYSAPSRAYAGRSAHARPPCSWHLH
eukprot:scaffold101276_cov52-Phaeocystis_antarctica.AAC.3